MASFGLLTDLAIALAAAAIGGFIATRLRLNRVVGYVVAGIAIGPFAAGYVARPGALAELSDLGLIFLLFSLGLGFSFGEMLSTGMRPLVASLLAMAAFATALGLGLPLAHLTHPWTFGLIATVSSTAIGAALLAEWGMLERASGKFVLAILVVQDLISVILIVIVSTPAQHLSVVGMFVPMIKAIGFVAIALLLGATILHYAVVRLLRSLSAEGLFPTFAALALVAAWIAHVAGLPFEFGAFVAGAVISEAAGSRAVQSIVAPFRAVFVALFFVSIGTLMDPKIVAEHWAAIVVIGIGLVLLRLGAWTAVARLAHFTPATALLLGVAMVPLGEFNIVLADAGAASNRIDAVERSIFLGVTFLSILLAAAISPLTARLRAPGRTERAAGFAMDPLPAGADVVIVGYGRVGKTVGSVLARMGVSFAVLEPERAIVERARRAGVAIRSGTGDDPLAMEAMLQQGTRVVIATTPSTAVNAAVADRANGVRGVGVVARASSLDDIAALEGHGATVLVPETEGALEFARAALTQLGYGADRVERAIDEQRRHAMDDV